ncbi:hypothetical protein Tco_0551691, partial [Tanacetum coccineum]
FHLMDPDEFEAPRSPEQAPPSPNYVPDPEYPEYLALSNGEIPDPEEDLEEDPVDYPADKGDDDEEGEESSKDDNDEEEEASEDDKDEEEEHLAPADSTILPAIDPVPSAEETKPFETDEARISARPYIPLSPSTKALIVEYASAPTPPLPPPSPLLLLSSPLPRIPSPPLLLPPLHTSPTYASAPLCYRAAMVHLRAASPSTYHPLHVPSPPLLLPFADYRSDIPEAEIPPRKRVCFTAPTRRFEVRESSTATATRQTGHTLARMVDYRFFDTLDASI